MIHFFDLTHLLYYFLFFLKLFQMKTFNFQGQLDKLINRTRQIQRRIPSPGSRIMGGLPDSAREQLRRFMDVYQNLTQIGVEVVIL